MAGYPRDVLRQEIVLQTQKKLNAAGLALPGRSAGQLTIDAGRLTGTAREVATEFRRNYRMDTWIVPLHRPSRQLVLRDRVFPNGESKISAVIEDILRRSAVGQPVLVGTRTLENSERLAAALEPTGQRFRLLNAKNEAEEAHLIELAGQPGAVTIATNMAAKIGSTNAKSRFAR